MASTSTGGGLSTAYSSLFSSGLDTAGRLPLATNRDFSGYRAPRAHNGFPKNFIAIVDSRRPSTDTESMHSRRSSLPTFSSGQSDRRIYAASPVRSPQAVSFTPSVLMRSDTNATKRSHFKSFLSMDANDQTPAPPLPSGLRSNVVPGYGPSQGSKLTRTMSVSSSVLPVSPSPHINHSTGNYNYVKPTSDGSPKDTEGAPQDTEGVSRRRSLDEERPYVMISDEPPRLDVRLDPSSSRISFYPSGLIHEEQERYAEARKSSITDPHSIPPRPDYEPRIRSSLLTSSIASLPPPPIPAKSIQRNMSVTSVSTFKSTTPSQRSAIKRSRRNEALARLEGNFYDPDPHIQSNGSFMPFESDDEEDDADKSANAMLRRLVISPAQSSPPPLIKPPSPLRARDREQRKFSETGWQDVSALDTIVEASLAPSPPRSDSEYNPAQARPDDPPSIVVMWPPFNEEEEEEEEESPLSTSQAAQPNSTTSKTTYGSSPLGSRTNLVMHSTNQSSASLSSFTPFADTDAIRSRNGTKAPSSSATHSPAHKPGSIDMMGSNSPRSHDLVSIRSFDSRDLGAALMESRSKQSTQNTPWGSSSSFGQDIQRSPWIQGVSAPMNVVKTKERAPPKIKEPKPKKRPARYETWLDMSGDENAAKDASKKRRWLFGK